MHIKINLAALFGYSGDVLSILFLYQTSVLHLSELAEYSITKTASYILQYCTHIHWYVIRQFPLFFLMYILFSLQTDA